MRKNGKFKIIADPRLLDLIGASMYTNYSKAIGEIVVNAYDADAKDVFIDVDKETITISDNGTGMTPSMIQDQYLHFGGDQKKSIEATPIFKRRPVGDKGIGKWAGLGIARRMCIISQKDGIKTSLVLDFDDLKEYKDISKVDLPCSIEKCDKDSHGTQIILSKLISQNIFTKVLIKNLSKDLPMDENIKYFVNNTLCMRSSTPAEITIDANDTVEPVGLITGKILILRHADKDSIPGVWTRVKGKVVGKPSLYGATAYTHFGAYTHLVGGELNADGLNDIIKTDRGGFNEDTELYKKYHEFVLKKIIELLWMKEQAIRQNKKQKILDEKTRALKTIISIFNGLQKEKERDKSFGKVSFKVIKPKERKELEIYDKRLRVELKLAEGIGNVRIADRSYKVVIHPCGTDETECLISDRINAICINEDNPCYALAKSSNNIEFLEYYMFKALTLAYVFKQCDTPEEMYDTVTKFMRTYVMAMHMRKK